MASTDELWVIAREKDGSPEWESYGVFDKREEADISAIEFTQHFKGKPFEVHPAQMFMDVEEVFPWLSSSQQ